MLPSLRFDLTNFTMYDISWLPKSLFEIENIENNKEILKTFNIFEILKFFQIFCIFFVLPLLTPFPQLTKSKI